MLKLIPAVLMMLILTLNMCVEAQTRIDPEKIKSQRIRTATKMTTDLKASDGFSSILSSTIIYDVDGNRIELMQYDPNGNLEMHYYYKYDGNGNLTEVIGLTPGGSVGNKWLYVYDEYNNMIRQTSYRPDGQIGRDYVFSYDEKGIRQSELIYNNKELVEQSEYIYEYYNSEE